MICKTKEIGNIGLSLVFKAEFCNQETLIDYNNT